MQPSPPTIQPTTQEPHNHDHHHHHDHDHDPSYDYTFSKTLLILASTFMLQKKRAEVKRKNGKGGRQDLSVQMSVQDG